MSLPSSPSRSVPSLSGQLQRWPVALVLAVLMVALFESAVLGPTGPWHAIKRKLRTRPVREARMEVGIAQDHLELARLARRPNPAGRA